MFQINEDMSIYVTRGDVAFFGLTADNGGTEYIFQPGDVVRFKVTEKKACENVAFYKDFPVLEETERIEILLTEEETKIGEVISKPTDYWYEVELNPLTNPQTIIGYDDDGAKIFKLFPEGEDEGEDTPSIEPEDIPVVDSELDMTSKRPVENGAIARALVALQNAVNVIAARFNNLFTLKPGSTTDDAEIADLRVGIDGTIYLSAGDAVRGQITGYYDKVEDAVGTAEAAFSKSVVMAKISESWAVGGTGVRVGEDTDNSMYYSEVSKAAAETAQNASTQAVNTLSSAQKVLGEAEETLEEMKKETPEALAGRVEELEQDKLDADGGVLVGNALGFGGNEANGVRVNANGTFTIGDLTSDYYGRDARRLGLYSNNTLQVYDLNGDAVYYFYGDTTRTSGSYSGTGAKRNVSVTTFYGRVQPQLVLVYGGLGMGFVTPNCGVWIYNGSGSINCEYSTYFNGYEIVMAADSWFNSLNDPYFYTIVYT